MTAYYFLRTKRNAPDFIVNLIDSCLGGAFLKKSKFRYSSGNNANIFFIVGCGRSGNTLLKNILSSQYDVCIPPEIPGLGNTIRQFTRSRHKCWADVVDDVLKEFKSNADISMSFERGDYNLDNILGIDYQGLRDSLISKSHSQRGLDTIIFSIYNGYAYSNGFPEGSAIGDKTPWNSFHLGRVIKTFPNAKFIHMVRDPRACAASYIHNFNGISELDARQASHRWVDTIKKVEGWKSLGKENFYELRYEDLVSDPDRFTSEVAKFLELKKHIKSDSGELDTFRAEEVLPHFSKSFSPPDGESLSKWKRLLTMREVKIVERLCSEKMKSYGYKPLS